ncbi:MAG: SWIM zinc finger family protein [Nanobdellota archaeon]
MNITKKGKIFIVQSSKKDKYYRVSLEKGECDCPHFLYRLKRTGEECKHLKAVKDLIKCHAKDDFEKAVDFVKKQESVDYSEFVELFSEGILYELIENGNLIKKNGEVRLLPQ